MAGSVSMVIEDFSSTPSCTFDWLCATLRTKPKHSRVSFSSNFIESETIKASCFSPFLGVRISHRYDCIIVFSSSEGISLFERKTKLLINEIYITNIQFLIINDEFDEIYLLISKSDENNDEDSSTTYEIVKMSLGKLLKTKSRSLIWEVKYSEEEMQIFNPCGIALIEIDI